MIIEFVADFLRAVFVIGCVGSFAIVAYILGGSLG